MAQFSPGGPFRQLLLGAIDLATNAISGVTAGTSQPRNCRGVDYLTVYLTASAALSAGTLIVEEASWDPQSTQPFSGTWSQIASYTLSSVFASTGGQSAQHLPVSAYADVRVRIGTTVVGGTLLVALEGN